MNVALNILSQNRSQAYNVLMPESDASNDELLQHAL
jgi:hypothetical protein